MTSINNPNWWKAGKPCHNAIARAQRGGGGGEGEVRGTAI